MHRVGHHRRFSTACGSHALLILGLLLSLLACPGAALASPAVAVEQRIDRPSVDLAAMALTPADIADADLIWEGSGDYGVHSSQLLVGDAYVAFLSAFLPASEERIAATFESAGLIRAHEVVISPRTVADGDAGRDILSSVVEYADRDGAASAWAFLQDLPSAGEVLEIEGLETVGEATYAIEEKGDDPDTGKPYAILEVRVLIGRFHIGVTLADWDGTEPNSEDAAALTQALGANVEEVQQSLARGLSNQVLRLTGESVNTTSDTYTLRAGRVVSLYNDPVEDPEEVEARVEALGQTHDYRVWQELVPATGNQGADSVYYLTVIRFVDDAAAAVWLADRPDLIEAYDSFTNVEFAPEDEVDYGDAAFSYTAESVTTGTHFHNFTVQVDNQIVILDVSGPTTAPVDAIAPLVEAQLACLEARECLEPMELPEALADFVEEIQEQAPTTMPV